MSLNLGLSDDFFITGMRLYTFGKNNRETSCLLRALHKGVHDVNMVITGDVNLDHSVVVGSGSFPQS